MYAAVGAGDLSSTQVSNAAQALLQDVPVSQHRVGRKSGGGASPSIQVSGVGNLLTHMAGCCKPLPGDAITGFVTRHRGVSVHRTDCGRLVRLQEQFPGQVIDVDWGAEPVGSYEVDVAIEAYDRQGLMRDITTLFANARANVLMINTQTRKSDNTAAMRLRIEVPGVDALSRLLERIERLNNVITARRVSD